MALNSLDLLNKILPKSLNPFKALGTLGKVKTYFAQAKIAVIILGALLIGILIALIILIVKKNRKK